MRECQSLIEKKKVIRNRLYLARHEAKNGSLVAQKRVNRYTRLLEELNENPSIKVYTSDSGKYGKKEIAQVDEKTGRVIRVFPSITEGGKAAGCSKQEIWKGINKGWKIKGFHWEYV